jgi:drug/metabolite transporter (DMT)-like permease
MRSRSGLRPEPLLFVALAFLFGSSYLVVHLAGTEVGPFTLVAMRLIVAVVALGAVAVIARTAFPARRLWPHLLVVGALGIAVPFSLITWSQRSVDSGLASIIVGATPLLSAIIVAGTTRDEPLGLVRIAGLALGFFGIVLVAGGGIGSGGQPLAIVALLVAAMSYAANGAYTRRFLAGTPPLTAAFGQAVGALLIVGVLSLVVERPAFIVPSTAVLGAALWLGLMPSGAAALIYFRLIARWGVTRTAMVNYVSPVVGLSAGIVVAGERPAPALFVGGALVILGVILASSNPSALAALARRPIRSTGLVARPAVP